MNHIKIFDTTLRDGAQSPGIKMNYQDKIDIAKKLEALGVDIIEAGFPISSEENFKSVQKISSIIKTSTVCALARANEQDIICAVNAIKNAKEKRIHTFIATSPIHMKKKLNLAPEDVIKKAVNSIKIARNHTDNIQFSAEDAFRSNPKFLVKIIEQVIHAGATTINIPDTVGYATPTEYGKLFKHLIKHVKNSHQATFSAHCHNDLGMAVANSLSAIQNGATQIEVSMNGLGERAGNAALEEIVMAIKTRPDIYKSQTQINTHKIFETAKFIEKTTSFIIPNNKAIIGKNAFLHESGIHQDGMLKSKDTYEIMKPEDVGIYQNSIVYGKNSGKAALAYLFKKHNITLTNMELINLFEKFKKTADIKEHLTEKDILNLLNQR